MNRNSTRPIALFNLAGVFFLSVTFLILITQTEISSLLGYVAAVNCTTFILCGYDKSISSGKSLRVPEVVFYIWTILGGGIGLLLGMQLFRHKTRKARFQFIAGTLVLAQLVLYAAFFKDI